MLEFLGDLGWFQFILILVGLLISAPVVIFLGYLLVILSFFLTIGAATAIGTACVLLIGGIIVIWESIRDRYRAWKAK